MQPSTSEVPRPLGHIEKVLLQRLIEEAHELRRPHPELQATYEVVQPNFKPNELSGPTLDYNAFRSIQSAPRVGNYCFKRHREELDERARELFEDYPFCLVPKKTRH